MTRPRMFLAQLSSENRSSIEPRLLVHSSRVGQVRCYWKWLLHPGSRCIIPGHHLLAGPKSPPKSGIKHVLSVHSAVGVCDTCG